jgi:hypothetical protein
MAPKRICAGDAPISVLFPVLREVNSRLCAQSAEYSHGTWLLVFIFAEPKTKPLPRNKRSPLSANSQKLSISILHSSVRSLPEGGVSQRTGTVFGNSSFVSLLRRLKNWLGVVLHSRLSKWKSPSTRKVNAVLGSRKVAKNNPSLINCMSFSGAPGQRHQQMPISCTPDLSITVMIGFPFLSLRPGFEPPKSS